MLFFSVKKDDKIIVKTTYIFHENSMEIQLTLLFSKYAQGYSP